MADDKDGKISTNTITYALGILILGALGWVGSNTTHIPAIEVTQVQQTKDIDSIKNQIEPVAVIKNQMDNITKQLDHINSNEDSSNRQSQTVQDKLSDHERRLQELEHKRE